MARTSIYLPKFRPDSKFTVTRFFRYNGVDMVPGMVVDRAVVSERALRQLFDQRKVRQEEAELVTAVAALGDTFADVDAAVIAAEFMDQPDLADAPQYARPLKVKHVGGGRWVVVDANGERVHEGTYDEKDEAAAFLASL
jgi:hypothetical protein